MTSQQKGKICKEDEKRIKLNFELINTELDGKDLVDTMFEGGIFSMDDMEEVRNAMPNIRKRRIEVFLAKLMNSGPNAYKMFITAVKKAEFEHVAEVLENTILVSEQAEEDWFESVPASRKTDKVREKELSRMVGALGEGWECVALELNISQVKIEQAKMSSTPYMQMFNTFIKWRQREAGKATFQAFVKALRACEDRITIDWDVIRHVVLNVNSL